MLLCSISHIDSGRECEKEEMSGFRGKRKEEDYASEGDSEGHAPARKKTFKKDSSDDSTEDIVVCEVPSLSPSLSLSLSICIYPNKCMFTLFFIFYQQMCVYTSGTVIQMVVLRFCKC